MHTWIFSFPPYTKKDFQLVRLYHPDKVGTSTSSDIAHTRFQAITAAYDVLRGKASGNNTTTTSGASGSANIPYQTTASWRAMRKRRQELYDSGPVNDGKNDNLIIIGVVAVKKNFLSIHSKNTYVRPTLDNSNCSIPNCNTPAGGTWTVYFKGSTTFYTRWSTPATGSNERAIISQQATGYGRNMTDLNCLLLISQFQKRFFFLFFVKCKIMHPLLRAYIRWVLQVIYWFICTFFHLRHSVLIRWWELVCRRIHPQQSGGFSR